MQGAPQFHAARESRRRELQGCVQEVTQQAALVQVWETGRHGWDRGCLGLNGQMKISLLSLVSKPQSSALEVRG